MYFVLQIRAPKLAEEIISSLSEEDLGGLPTLTINDILVDVSTGRQTHTVSHMYKHTYTHTSFLLWDNYYFGHFIRLSPLTMA